jgi:AAA15 family ATPase/GTPase
LFDELTGAISVHKDRAGHYHFLDANDDAAYKNRKQQIESVISKGSNSPGYFNIHGSNTQVNLTFNTFEDVVFHQFPSIYLFNEKYSLREALPERIDNDWASSNNSFEKLFVQYLGEEAVNRFLRSNDPDEREELLKQLRSKMSALTQKVNQHRPADEKQDLIEITLHEKNGIQITVKTDGKKSYYSHLSDNTKFLFAYYLYQEVNEISRDVLLFDEPNNGFHPTAQEFLLNFLKQLATVNLVIVATHSEHMIDLDRVSGIRLMGVDAQKNITVKNHFYNQPVEKGDYLALQPLLDAIGFRYGSQIHLKDKITVAEGVTDLLYIRAFNTILQYAQPVDIAPARGDGTILNIIPLLIAQGISFKIVLDTGEVKQRIQGAFGIDDQFVFEVPIPAAYVGHMQRSGIEDLFTKGDFERLLRDSGHVPSADFPHVSNSQYMRTAGLKRVTAENFYKKADKQTEKDFEADTINSFRTLLEFCKNADWFVL